MFEVLFFEIKLFSCVKFVLSVRIDLNVRIII